MMEMSNMLDAIANGKTLLFFVVALTFWLISIPDHRSGDRTDKIKVNRCLAALCGSKNSWVNWRSLSFQLGFASLILWHFLAVWNGKSHSSFVFVPALLTILVIQIWIRIRMRIGGM